MTDYFEVMKTEQDNIKSATRRLSDHAGAFLLVGNTDYAYRLLDIIETLNTASDNINNAIDSNLRNRFEQSQQSTINMVNAALVAGKNK